MELSPEAAVVMFAVSNIAGPLLTQLLSRRSTKAEAAVEQVPVLQQRLNALEEQESASSQVPLLVQRMETVVEGVNEIKTELRVVREHDSLLRLMEQRVRALEVWRAEVVPKLDRSVSETHLLMGERNARQLQHSANLVEPLKVARPTP
ncbi:hypothetical protein [Myxococcus xanthus]|uniref:hypothetical protein n=1 Tax=Myxococcus xanthus TaxID=34 RepID=UPI001127F677|nr:hypothetical protein [Myxococcus xanthus]QDE83325.1 hypothetical protein BHS07_18145 [Myxococcus xanthus]